MHNDLIVFDFLNGEGNNKFQTLQNYCYEMELYFNLYCMKELASQLRFVLEGFFAYLGYDGKDLSENMRAASRDQVIYGSEHTVFDTLHKLGNWGAHKDSEPYGKTDDNLSHFSFFKDNRYSDIINEYNGKKWSILADLKDVMETVFVRKKRGKQANDPNYTYTSYSSRNREEIDYRKILPYINESDGTTYIYEEELEWNKNYFMCRSTNPNDTKKYLTRIINNPSMNRERDFYQKYGHSVKLSKDCLESVGLRYYRDQLQIIMLPLRNEYQKTLYDYIKTIKAELKIENIRDAVDSADYQHIIKKIISDTAIIIKELNDGVTLENGIHVSMCHRNINPNTIIVEKKDNGIELKLSCFDHVKLHISDGTVTSWSALSFDSNPFTIPSNELRKFRIEGFISLENSKKMDNYAIAMVLIYLFLGGFIRNDTNESFGTFKNSYDKKLHKTIFDFIRKAITAPYLETDDLINELIDKL